MTNCGVYIIRNSVNGKVYVGSSRRLSIRKSQHLQKLRKGTHGNKHLQSAYSKYGADAFEFCVIEECEQSRLGEVETYHILSLNSAVDGYNILPSGFTRSPEVRAKQSEFMMGKKIALGRECSEETRRHMSASRMGNTNRLGHKASAAERAAGSKGQTGRVHPPETKAKIAEAHKGKSHTPETRAKMSEAQKRRFAKNRGEVD